MISNDRMRMLNKRGQSLEGQGGLITYTQAATEKLNGNKTLPIWVVNQTFEHRKERIVPADKNCATVIMVLYSTGDGKRSHIKSNGISDGENSGNHGERIAWNLAQKNLALLQRKNPELTIEKIVVHSDRSPCNSDPRIKQTNIPRCDDFFNTNLVHGRDLFFYSVDRYSETDKKFKTTLQIKSELNADIADATTIFEVSHQELENKLSNLEKKSNKLENERSKTNLELNEEHQEIKSENIESKKEMEKIMVKKSLLASNSSNSLPNISINEQSISSVFGNAIQKNKDKQIDLRKAENTKQKVIEDAKKDGSPHILEQFNSVSSTSLISYATNSTVGLASNNITTAVNTNISIPSSSVQATSARTWSQITSSSIAPSNVKKEEKPQIHEDSSQIVPNMISFNTKGISNSIAQRIRPNEQQTSAELPGGSKNNSRGRGDNNFRSRGNKKPMG